MITEFSQTISFDGNCCGSNSPIEFKNISGTLYNQASCDIGKRLRLLNPSGCQLNISEFTKPNEAFYLSQIANASPTLGAVPSGMIINNSGNFNSMIAGDSCAFVCVDSTAGAQIVDLL